MLITIDEDRQGVNLNDPRVRSLFEDVGFESILNALIVLGDQITDGLGGQQVWWQRVRSSDEDFA